MNPLSGLNEGALAVYSTVALGVGVVTLDAIGLIGVSYDLSLVVLFLILVGCIHLYGKVGIEKY